MRTGRRTGRNTKRTKTRTKTSDEDDGDGDGDSDDDDDEHRHRDDTRGVDERTDGAQTGWTSCCVRGYARFMFAVWVGRGAQAAGCLVIAVGLWGPFGGSLGAPLEASSWVPLESS